MSDLQNLATRTTEVITTTKWGSAFHCDSIKGCDKDSYSNTKVDVKTPPPVPEAPKEPVIEQPVPKQPAPKRPAPVPRKVTPAPPIEVVPMVS